MEHKDTSDRPARKAIRWMAEGFKSNKSMVIRATGGRFEMASVSTLPILAENSEMASERIKEEILSSCRSDFSQIMRDQLTSASVADFRALKSELRELPSEGANNTAAIWAEVDHIKAGARDMTAGILTWSDEVTSFQGAVSSLQNVVTLKDQCWGHGKDNAALNRSDSRFRRTTEFQLH